MEMVFEAGKKKLSAPSRGRKAGSKKDAKTFSTLASTPGGDS
jgi:hypothetical protein